MYHRLQQRYRNDQAALSWGRDMCAGATFMVCWRHWRCNVWTAGRPLPCFYWPLSKWPNCLLNRSHLIMHHHLTPFLLYPPAFYNPCIFQYCCCTVACQVLKTLCIQICCTLNTINYRPKSCGFIMRRGGGFGIMTAHLNSASSRPRHHNAW